MANLKDPESETILSTIGHVSQLSYWLAKTKLVS